MVFGNTYNAFLCFDNIYAIFENYLIVIPKHVPEYFQVIEHVPRFGSPHCPWHWQWNDRSFWTPQGLYSALHIPEIDWLIVCPQGTNCPMCISVSYVLIRTYCIYFAHAHVTWYLGIGLLTQNVTGYCYILKLKSETENRNNIWPALLVFLHSTTDFVMMPRREREREERCRPTSSTWPWGTCTGCHRRGGNLYLNTYACALNDRQTWWE